MKPHIIEKPSLELVELISKVVKRTRDPQDIVSKTAKKLIIELEKCYPNNFESCLVTALRNEEERAICRAVMANDEEEL